MAIKAMKSKEAAPFEPRIRKAREEGRTQQALELAKQLVKQEPTEANKALHRDVMIERGNHLLADGHQREAGVVFGNALRIGGPPDFLALVAGKLAQCGETQAAAQIAASLPPGEQAKVLAQTVDAALTKGAAGRGLVGDDLRPGFDAIIKAFECAEQHRDDAAREALQTIGLQSPYMEWRVLARGLLAFFANDDAKALENWTRLDPNRIPHRLSAVFRSMIDAGFRDAQSAQAKERLRAVADRYAGIQFVNELRKINGLLNRDDFAGMEPVLRQARALTARLTAVSPDLVLKLGRILYWEVVNRGAWDDVALYRAAFPAPPDDPRLNRMSALVSDNERYIEPTIDHWLAYEKDLATLPGRFPGASCDIARALVWEHLGEIVALMGKNPHLLRKSDPTPEQCCEKSMALAPDRLKPYEELFRLHRLRGQTKKSIDIAKNLVAKFPEHAETWNFLGQLATDEDAEEALRCFRAAQKANPLEPEYRESLIGALCDQAMRIAAAVPKRKKKETAPRLDLHRPLFEEAVRLYGGESPCILSRWLVAESRLENADMVAQLQARLANDPVHRVAGPLGAHIAAQVTGGKVTPAGKSAFVAALDLQLNQPPSRHELIPALEAIASFRKEQVKGIRALVKRVLPALTNNFLEPLSEMELIRLGLCLSKLGETKSLGTLKRHLERRFPRSPDVHLFDFDTMPKGDRRVGQMSAALDRAREAAAKLPRETQERVNSEIERRKKRFKNLLDAPPPAMFDMLEELMGRFGGGRRGPFGGFGFGMGMDGFEDDCDDD